MTFSLFYFAAGEDAASDGYRLLLESARFADRNGFEAVWTPERHFHAFGGAYPNPSVTGAALAAITEHVGIRAGSVVLPLHSPIRVAEEWSVVDNLSRGRVAISFAAGWQPNDFVLNPTGYANAKEELARNIELVQRLWRGETVSMPGHDGAPVEVRTLPRPVQAELPVWLTSAGSPATFERAGTLGVNVLTHLLGQSVEQLAENVARYRAAWRAAGHEGEGRVTLMMHTYLDRDADIAREVAREPMKGYLGTAVGLLRDVASAFPTFAGRGKGTDDLFKSLSPEEMDQLLEMAAHRYLSTSGLFGTPEDAARIVEEVSAAGVDEVACLVDFGIETDDVLASLELLLEAKARGRRPPPERAGARQRRAVDEAVDDSVAGLVARHGVTHLQCTPSLAAMIVADPADRAALGTVRHLMLGGEALSTALAAEIRALLPGRFTNMYGPTETTIWSLTHEIDGAADGRRADRHADRQHDDLRARRRRSAPPDRRLRRAAHRRRGCRSRLPRPARADRRAIRRPSRDGPGVRHRRRRAHPPGRSRRVLRPFRQPGQDPRPPHRARRDRGGPRPPSRRRAVRRGCPRGQGRHEARRLRHPPPRCRRHVGRAAQARR